MTIIDTRASAGGAPAPRRPAARTTRRTLLTGAAALAVTGLSASGAGAQGDAIRLGTLTPLTGAGGSYGPSMRTAMEWVVEQVNGAGGVLGRRIRLFNEDDQTSPDAAVRAARKLIDVDRVAAIMGTWASAVTTAVAPLCWESKTFLTTVSGADSITLLPHQGYLIRTQPNGHLQATKLGEFLLTLKVKRVYVMSAQTPYALPVQKRVAEVLAAGGSEVVGGLVYDRDKATYRSEIDQALKPKPDKIFVTGYTPDVTVVLKELYKAGYNAGKVAPAFAVNQKLLGSLPTEVTDGTYTWAPSPAPDSDAYKRLAKVLGTDDIDPYSCQTHDQASLVVLALAQAKGEATGTAIRDNVRKISQGSGVKVESAVEGLKLVAQGKAINYEGASGPCDFTEIGDILDCKFRYEQAEKGKFKLLKIG